MLSVRTCFQLVWWVRDSACASMVPYVFRSRCLCCVALLGCLSTGRQMQQPQAHVCAWSMCTSAVGGLRACAVVQKGWWGCGHDCKCTCTCMHMCVHTHVHTFRHHHAVFCAVSTSQAPSATPIATGTAPSVQCLLSYPQRGFESWFQTPAPGFRAKPGSTGSRSPLLHCWKQIVHLLCPPFLSLALCLLPPLLLLGCCSLHTEQQIHMLIGNRPEDRPELRLSLSRGVGREEDSMHLELRQHPGFSHCPWTAQSTNNPVASSPGLSLAWGLTRS